MIGSDNSCVLLRSLGMLVTRTWNRLSFINKSVVVHFGTNPIKCVIWSADPDRNVSEWRVFVYGQSVWIVCCMQSDANWEITCAAHRGLTPTGLVQLDEFRRNYILCGRSSGWLFYKVVAELGSQILKPEASSGFSTSSNRVKHFKLLMYYLCFLPA